MNVYNSKTTSYLEGCLNGRYYLEIKRELVHFPISSRYLEKMKERLALLDVELRRVEVITDTV